MISRGVRAACRESVAAVPVKVAIWGMINANNPHVPEDPQPTPRPAPLADVAAQ